MLSSPLADENTIVEVHYFEHDISYTINKRWLLDALKYSKEVERPTEVMALEFELTFIFASNKEITLRYLDDRQHIFSVRSSEENYILQGEEICIWLDYLVEETLGAHSARGIVMEVNPENNYTICCR